MFCVNGLPGPQIANSSLIPLIKNSHDVVQVPAIECMVIVLHDPSLPVGKRNVMIHNVQHG
jgi:hypothetical protein